MNAMNNGQRPGGENGNDFVEEEGGAGGGEVAFGGNAAEMNYQDDYDDEGEYAMDQYDDEEQYYDDDGIRQPEFASAQPMDENESKGEAGVESKEEMHEGGALDAIKRGMTKLTSAVDALDAVTMLHTDMVATNKKALKAFEQFYEDAVRTGTLEGAYEASRNYDSDSSDSEIDEDNENQKGQKGTKACKEATSCNRPSHQILQRAAPAHS